ncbi:hypothetical protein EDD11_004520 [Mortierella claussenii]|nr:hypothetical protein EDD11_004520 [Mortierella claussenii]
MVPPLEAFGTEETRDFWGTPDKLIKDPWPLKDNPDVVLISLFLNPACASLKMSRETRTSDNVDLITKAKKGLVTAALTDFLLERAHGENKDNATTPDKTMFGLYAMYPVELY